MLLALGGAPQPYALKWQPVPGAVSYRAVLARDESLNDVVAEAAPQADGGADPRPASTLPPGRYYARVQAVDALGLPGMPSLPRRVEVVAVKVERGEVEGPGQVKGRGQVKLSVDPAVGVPLRVKGKAVGTEAVLLAPGLHTVDVEERHAARERGGHAGRERRSWCCRPKAGRFELEINARPKEAGPRPSRMERCR